MGLTPTVVGGAFVMPTWGNEIRDRTLQVFQTTQERDAGWLSPPNAAHCITLDTYTTWVRKAGAWTAVTAVRQGGFSTGDVNFPQAGSGGLVNVQPPQQPWPTLFNLTIHWAMGFATGSVTVNGYYQPVGGAVVALHTLVVPGASWGFQSTGLSAAVPANTAFYVVVGATLSTPGYAGATGQWVQIPN